MHPSEAPKTENKEVVLTDVEIFKKLWSEPRLVFRFIHDHHYDKYTHVLLILAAIVRGLDQAATKSMGDKMSLPAVLAISIIAGGIFGWMSYYIYAAMTSWTGKWLKGEADTTSLLRVLAYAMTPSILSLLILIPQIAIFGNGIFQSEINLEDNNTASSAFYYISLLVELTLGIWTLCFIVVGISEVQKFSIGKAILNLLLPALIILAIVTLIVVAAA